MKWRTGPQSLACPRRSSSNWCMRTAPRPRRSAKRSPVVLTDSSGNQALLMLRILDLELGNGFFDSALLIRCRHPAIADRRARLDAVISHSNSLTVKVGFHPGPSKKE